MKRLLLIEVEAGEKGTCGECDRIHEDAWGDILCGAFMEDLHDGLCCPACLDAESRAKDLIEAAEKSLTFFGELNSWCWPDKNNMAVGHRAKIVKMIDRSGAWPALAAALAAIRGSKDEPEKGKGE